jgi:hypothetical protein
LSIPAQSWYWVHFTTFIPAWSWYCIQDWFLAGTSQVYTL